MTRRTAVMSNVVSGHIASGRSTSIEIRSRPLRSRVVGGCWSIQRRPGHLIKSRRRQGLPPLLIGLPGAKEQFLDNIFRKGQIPRISGSKAIESHVIPSDPFLDLPGRLGNHDREHSRAQVEYPLTGGRTGTLFSHLSRGLIF